MIVLMFHSLTSPVSIKSIRKWLLIIYHAVNRERENKSKRGMVNICLTSPFFCSIKRFKEMGNGLLRSNQPAVSLSNGLPVGIKEQKIKKNQNSGHPGQIQDASKPVLQNLIEMLQFQNHWPWMNKNKKKNLGLSDFLAESWKNKQQQQKKATAMYFGGVFYELWPGLLSCGSELLKLWGGGVPGRGIMKESGAFWVRHSQQLEQEQWLWHTAPSHNATDSDIIQMFICFIYFFFFDEGQLILFKDICDCE